MDREISTRIVSIAVGAQSYLGDALPVLALSLSLFLSLSLCAARRDFFRAPSLPVPLPPASTLPVLGSQWGSIDTPSIPVRYLGTSRTQRRARMYPDCASRLFAFQSNLRVRVTGKYSEILNVPPCSGRAGVTSASARGIEESRTLRRLQGSRGNRPSRRESRAVDDNSFDIEVMNGPVSEAVNLVFE